MIYEPKDYTSLLGTSGFSDDLLKNHFTLYGGYVANTNKLLDLLKETEPGTPQFAELKRRFGWEFNGMRLHELYFENMSKKPVELGDDSLLYKKMKEVFGSGEGCEKDFKATGAMRGIGWTILAYDKEGDRLFNIWINEHDAGYLAGASDRKDVKRILKRPEQCEESAGRYLRMTKKVTGCLTYGLTSMTQAILPELRPFL